MGVNTDGRKTDPRIALGYSVEARVVGPYEVMEARDTGGAAGGTLDRGIIARTEAGLRVVIGEIWAACPDENDGKTRIDASAVVDDMLRKLNAFDDLLEAAKTIENDAGQVPEWLWDRIQAAIAKAEGGES